eukprot:GILJ01001654.1.p1 GENE.GILJ01001654.1~~GILJ01001654.1.p1  ORF type:complete len:2297 (+),score=271.16 GILJ01001654.1:26-6916(+)
MSALVVLLVLVLSCAADASLTVPITPRLPTTCASAASVFVRTTDDNFLLDGDGPGGRVPFPVWCSHMTTTPVGYLDLNDPSGTNNWGQNTRINPNYNVRTSKVAWADLSILRLKPDDMTYSWRSCAGCASYYWDGWMTIAACGSTPIANSRGDLSGTIFHFPADRSLFGANGYAAWMNFVWDSATPTKWVTAQGNGWCLDSPWVTLLGPILELDAGYVPPATVTTCHYYPIDPVINTNVTSYNYPYRPTFNGSLPYAIDSSTLSNPAFGVAFKNLGTNMTDTVLLYDPSNPNITVDITNGVISFVVPLLDLVPGTHYAVYLSPSLTMATTPIQPFCLSALDPWELHTQDNYILYTLNPTPVPIFTGLPVVNLVLDLYALPNNVTVNGIPYDILAVNYTFISFKMLLYGANTHFRYDSVPTLNFRLGGSRYGSLFTWTVPATPKIYALQNSTVAGVFSMTGANFGPARAVDPLLEVKLDGLACSSINVVSSSLLTCTVATPVPATFHTAVISFYGATVLDGGNQSFVYTFGQQLEATAVMRQGVCGDGRYYAGFEACEDGNTLSGDGCASDCSIETGYVCVGGSTTSTQACYYSLQSLIPSRMTVSSSNASATVVVGKPLLPSVSLSLLVTASGTGSAGVTVSPNPIIISGTDSATFTITTGSVIGDVQLTFTLSGTALPYVWPKTSFQSAVMTVYSSMALLTPPPLMRIMNSSIFTLDLGAVVGTASLDVNISLSGPAANGSLISPQPLLLTSGQRYQSLTLLTGQYPGDLTLSIVPSGAGMTYFEGLTYTFPVRYFMQAPSLPQGLVASDTSAPVTLNISMPVPTGLTLTVAITVTDLVSTPPATVSLTSLNFAAGDVTKTFTVTAGPVSNVISFAFAVSGTAAAIYEPPPTQSITAQLVRSLETPQLYCGRYNIVTVNVSYTTGVSGSSRCWFNSTSSTIASVDSTLSQVACSIPTGLSLSPYRLRITYDGVLFFEAGTVYNLGCAAVQSRCPMVRLNGKCTFNITFSPPPASTVTMVLTTPSSFTILGGNTLNIPAGKKNVSVTVVGGSSITASSDMLFGAMVSADLAYMGAYAYPRSKGVEIVDSGTMAIDITPLQSRTNADVSFTVTLSQTASHDVFIPVRSSFNARVSGSNPVVVSAGSSVGTVVFQGTQVTNSDPWVQLLAATSDDAHFDGVAPDNPTKYLHVLQSALLFVTQDGNLDFTDTVTAQHVIVSTSFPPTANVTFNVTAPSFLVLAGPYVEPAAWGYTFTIPAATQDTQMISAFALTLTAAGNQSEDGNLTISIATSGDPAYDGVVPSKRTLAVARSICGDGIIIGAEQCDDANLQGGDGCTPTCMLEPGFVCSFDSAVNHSVCMTQCGDGLKAGAEGCDDKNVNSGDGCSSTCALEAGFICTGGSPYNKDVCTPCARGMFNVDPLQRMCSQCPPGTYNDGFNATSCTACPAGTYGPSFGLVACLPCAAGSYTNDTGAVSCAKCPYTQYQNGTGATHCIDCPTGTIVQSGGSRIEDCGCAQDFYTVGVRRFDCAACPPGATCAGGNSHPLPLPGYWSPAVGRGNTVWKESVMYECSGTTACPGGALGLCGKDFTGDLCGLCMPGFYVSQGRCLQCPDQSAASFAAVIIAVPLFCLFMYHFATSKLYTEDYWIVSLSSNINTMIAYVQTVAVYSGFAVHWPGAVSSFMNTFSFFNFNLEFVKPDCMVEISYEMRYLGKIVVPLIFVATFFALYGVSQACVWWSNRRKRHSARIAAARYKMVETDSPVPYVESNDPLPEAADGVDLGFVDQSGEVEFTEKHKEKKKLKAKKKESTLLLESRSSKHTSGQFVKLLKHGWDTLTTPLDFDRLINCILLSVDLMCISLLNSAVQLFQCKPQHDGTSTLVAYPSLVCYSAEWYRILPLGVVALILYGGGIACMYIYVAVRAPANWLNPRWRQRFQSLYIKYRKETWFWCFMGFLRKLALSFFITLASSDGFMQSLMVLLFNAAFVVLYAHYWPWRSWTSNVLDVCLLILQLALSGLTFFFVDGSFATSRSPADVELIANMAIGLIVIGVILSVWFSLYDFLALYFERREKQRNPQYIGLDKKGLQAIEMFASMHDKFAVDSKELFQQWYLQAAAYERFTTIHSMNAIMGDMWGVKGLRPRLVNPTATPKMLGDTKANDAANMLRWRTNSKLRLSMGSADTEVSPAPSPLKRTFPSLSKMRSLPGSPRTSQVTPLPLSVSASVPEVLHNVYSQIGASSAGRSSRLGSPSGSMNSTDEWALEDVIGASDNEELSLRSPARFSSQSYDVTASPSNLQRGQQ